MTPEDSPTRDQPKEDGAKQGASPPKPLSRWSTVKVTVRFVGPRIVLYPIIAFGASLLTTVGRDVHIDFYSAVAQVAPVLALAAVVESAVSLRGLSTQMPSEDRDDPDLLYLLALHEALASMAAFAFAEGASLYAVASQTTTTVLLSLSVLGLLSQSWAIVRAVANRFRPWEVGGS